MKIIFCSQNQMIRPIQFRQKGSVNLNLLKCQLDRRVDLITIMVKGMKGKKSCSDQCCNFKDNFCQTEETFQPLGQITNLSQSKTPSMKSLKSPSIIKKSDSNSNKENNLSKSSKQISTKQVTRKLLKQIRESQQQALKTSRYQKQLQYENKKQLQSDHKKHKKVEVKSSNRIKNMNSSKISASNNVQKKNQNMNTATKQDGVINSFQSNKRLSFTNRKQNSTAVKGFNYCSEDAFFNLSINSKKFHDSERRKNSISDSNGAISSSKVMKHQKKVGNSLSTNNLSSSFPTMNCLDESLNTAIKRIKVSQQLRQKILSDIQKRLQGKNNKNKQPIINNIRISLLKRLQDKHQKAQQTTI